MIDHYVKDGLDDPIGETAMGKRLSDGAYDDISEKVRLAMMAAHHPEAHVRAMENEVVSRLQAAEYRAITAENGLAEIKRMEAMIGKAPCITNHVNPPMQVEGFPDVNALAAWSAKDAD